MGGGRASRNDPGFKDAGNAKQVLHPNPAQSQAFPVSSWALALRVVPILGAPLSPRTRKKNGGGEGDGDLVEQDDRAGHYNLRFRSRGSWAQVS